MQLPSPGRKKKQTSSFQKWKTAGGWSETELCRDFHVIRRELRGLNMSEELGNLPRDSRLRDGYAPTVGSQVN